MKLGLGTVQFGLNYGVSNTQGQTDRNTVARILKLAATNGIKILDTAPVYGSSEEILGKEIPVDHSFKIITKIPKIKTNRVQPESIKDLLCAFNQSLEKLQQRNIYGLLFHNPEDLLIQGGEHLYEKAAELKSQNLIQKIGVSVYNPQQLEQLRNKYQFDIVQLPINVFDQRFLGNGYLKDLKNSHIEIHARSVFLQGLLLMSLEEMPAFFSPIKNHVNNYFDFLKLHELNQLSASLGFVLEINEIDVVVCGVNHDDQLNDLLKVKPKLKAKEFEFFQLRDENFINPTKWKL